MSAEDNKAIVGRWFTEFWGNEFNPAVIDERPFHRHPLGYPPREAGRPGPQRLSPDLRFPLG